MASYLAVNSSFCFGDWRFGTGQSQQPVVEPLHRLKDGLLLCEFLNFLRRISPDRETMDYSRVEADLVRLASLLQNLLRLVALVSREDAVGLGGSDGEGARDGRKLILLDIGWVSHETHIDSVLVVTDHILRPEAVAQGADLGDSIVFLQGLDSCLHDGVNRDGGVGILAAGAFGEPPREVKPGLANEGQSVAIEDIKDQGVVAICGQMIRHKLRIGPDAYDIRKVQQAYASMLLLRSRGGDVGVPLARNLDSLARGLALVFEPNCAAFRGRVGRHCEVGGVLNGRV